MPARPETVAQLPAHPTSYVEDLAGVIDAGSRQEMESLSREVYEKAHATVEIVTIHSLEGESIEDYATALEDRWKVGPKETDRGVIMLFSMDDRKRRIEVGYGLEGILNDAKVGDIGRSMLPGLQAGNYGPAILSGEQQIANDIAADAGVTLTPVQAQPRVEYQQRAARRRGFNWVGLTLFILFILLTFRGGRRGGGASIWPWFLLGNMMGGGGDRWRDRDDNWRGGGGGGFGGGDGSGGGDGGGDFGGGFGGGSGGGGASGDW